MTVNGSPGPLFSLNFNGLLAVLLTFSLLAPWSKEPVGDSVYSLLVPGLRIPVEDVVLRFSASPGAGTKSTTGAKELRNKSLAGPCTRGAEKLKNDVTHRYPRTGYQRTGNKVIRRSAMKRFQVLPKERQSAVKEVAQENRFFYGQKTGFSQVPFFARVPTSCFVQKIDTKPTVFQYLYRSTDG